MKEEEEFIASKLDDIEKLRMELRFLRTFVLFGNSSWDDFYGRMSLKIKKFDGLTWSLFYEDEDESMLAKYDMECLAPQLLKEMTTYLSLENEYAATTTEEKMFEYLFKHLHDLPKYCANLLLPLMSDFKILRQVFRHLRDFYPIHTANKTSTEYLYHRFQLTADRVAQFCFDLWAVKDRQDFCDEYTAYDISQCSSNITSLLIDIIPLELEVLYICTSKLMKESRSSELEGFVKQILKASPRILQNYLIHLQGRMEGAVAVNYTPTQSIKIMMEFLLIFLTDVPKCFIHRDKLNDMLAHVGVLTRKISILVTKQLDESSENNINKADFSAPDFFQEIEQMKGDITQIFMKVQESSQLHFPVDDGLLFMNLLLRHLNDLLISNVYSVSLIKKEIGMVKESLEFLISSFRKVGQTLDNTNGVVKDCWLRASEVAYEAEHVINCILVRDKALSHLIFSLPSVIDKIKLIVEEVASLQLEDKNQDDSLDAKSSHETIELTSSSFVEATVAREKDEAWIIRQLLDVHESELDVIPIVGMPGLGKTTLANKVYKDTLVASHFDVRAWCTVSQKYNKSKVLGEILQQVSGSEGNSENDLAEKLRRALLDKRYLIVLDDVWDIATGEMLIACFPKVKIGSRIILTSRSKKVGLQVKCRSDPHELKVLTYKKSWELFEKRVFGEGSCPSELSDVGRQIVEKCKGLPLALVLIAGVIVRMKENKKDLWLKIQHNLDSFISANNNLQMMKVMQLSYDHLPYHLKPLLLYFARSQKSERTPVSKLMQLWMAEGFVDHIPSKSNLEEATQSYLNDLISSSLIMVDDGPCESSRPISVMLKVCYVHDVVHDFCTVKSTKGKFFKLIDSDAPFHASDFLHRRLTIHTDDSQLQKRCVLFNSNKSSAGSKHLISLKVSSSVRDPSYFCHTRHLRLLRVLQLDNIILEDSLTEEIGSLFHLTFLRIETRGAKVIPLSWLNLQNLETLFINTGYSTMVLLPRICKLLKLRHVNIVISCFFGEEEEEDPENSNLTTLSQVHISYTEGTSDALEKFPNLQHLDCIIKEPTVPPTHGDWFPKLDVLTKLESLFATYQNLWSNNFCIQYRTVLNQIPPPIEYHFPTSLKVLRLNRFPLIPALLSAIVALPELEILVLKDSRFSEDKWDASNDIYQSLKTLHLVCTKISEWQVDGETFPKLEELILEHCDEITEIPSEFGDIDTLVSIRVVQGKRHLGNSANEIKKCAKYYTGQDRIHVRVSYAYGDSSDEQEDEELSFEEERTRIRNLIDEFLNGLDQIRNELIASKLHDFEKLRMELRFLRTFVLFGNSSLDDFYDRIFVDKFVDLTDSIFDKDKFVLAKYDMDDLAPYLLKKIKRYLRLDNVATTTEEKMFEYRESIFKHLYDLPMYCSNLLLPLMSEYKILREVCRHLRDFYGMECIAVNKTRTEYLYPSYQMILDRVTQFCFDLWTGDSHYFEEYDVSQCSSKIASLLIDIIPFELDVLCICTSKIKKQPSSTELNGWVKQILKTSPRILQNYLILLQRRMEGALAVNYAPTQGINVMMEFLLIFLTDIPKRFIHREKLNDMLAHVGVLTRKISILVSKLLEESSGTNINEAEFSAPALWQEIERMKEDIRQIFLKAPESSRLCFRMDDGFLFLNLLLRHLNDLLISNVYSVALIKKEIGMVKESLEFLRSSFGKVRQTLDDSGVVKDCWVRALEVAYESEHVINCILVRDKALPHLIFSLPSVTDRIKLIVAEVTSLQLEDKNGDDALDAKSSDEPIESTSSSFVEVTVGHEEEADWIIHQLLDEHESELDVISIVGMPGLGKTTLAKKVYKNALVASHFNDRAWCTVSQKYNKSKVLREILQQVTGLEEKESAEDLAENLKSALLDYRYLIVLDDVWDIATAEMLIACFPKVKRGNRIILTSQSSKVGWQVKCCSDPLHLQLLKPEKSWELFEKRLFGDHRSCPAELSHIGHRIVEKCQGLPLAVVLIAGVILIGREGKKKEKEKDLWLKIQHNMDSFISANYNLQMMKVMQLSYDHLPSHLKPLLLYFARSQKNKRTPVSKLMQLWVAEGLVDRDITPKGTQSDLDTLISSSLIMVDHVPCENDQPFSGMIKVCYVHDFVHDFCSVKAKKEKFLKLINSGDPFHASDFLHRRLTIHTEKGQLQKRCTALFNSNKSSAGSKNLMSLKVSGSIDNSRYICHTRHLRLLRVLQLGNIVLGESLAEEIGSLFHLRFLRIKANLKAIPMSWVNLQNLETLLIEKEFPIIVLLPRILKLSKLKHVSIKLSSFFEVGYSGDIITDQPSRILQAESSKLEDLTALSQVLISYAEGTNDALDKFPNLQHLDCTIKEPIDPPTDGDWFPKLDVLTELESLIARYLTARPAYYYNHDPELKDKIPPPKEYHFPNSLKELRLYGFPMRPALFSAIAALPELEILEIIDCHFMEKKWDASEDIYRSLKTLRLQYAQFSEWEVDGETFPKLEELILEHCYELTEIPSAFVEIESLKSIRVVQINSDLGDSAMEIKNYVKAFTGEDRLHVHVSFCE